MDLQDQLSDLFPDRVQGLSANSSGVPKIPTQDGPILCRYEKRGGKPTTVIEGFEGCTEDFKLLARDLKTELGVGGGFKDGRIFIQGRYRDEIMGILSARGFRVKRVGG